MFSYLKHILPKSGKSFRLPYVYGSSDAYLLAKLAAVLKIEHRMLIVLTVDIKNARRLSVEIPWFYQSMMSHSRIQEELVCSVLPDLETLPYDMLSPHCDLVSERLSTLSRVLENNCDVLILPLTTILLRIAPPEFFKTHTFFLKLKEKFHETDFKSILDFISYQGTTRVTSPGEYSLNNDVVNVFPMGSLYPYRLSLRNDVIVKIMTFDVCTQRSLCSATQLCLLPRYEFPMQLSICQKFCQRWCKLFGANSTKTEIFVDINRRIASSGIEYYLPLFFKHVSTLFEYIKPNSIFFTMGDIKNIIASFLRDVNLRFEFLKNNLERPVLAPSSIFLQIHEFYKLIKNYGRLSILAENSSSCLSKKIPNVIINKDMNDPLSNLRYYLSCTKKRVMLSIKSHKRYEELQEYFARYNLYPKFCKDYKDFLESNVSLMLCVAPLCNGFELLNSEFSFITEAELYVNFNHQCMYRSTNLVNIDRIVQDLSELKVGDPIVHIKYGIGRYTGLITINFGEGETEFLNLCYADDAKLYVPVSQLQLISRYSGVSSDHIPLHALNSDQWEKSKQKVIQKIYDTAVELLNLYANRKLRSGYTFQYSVSDYEKFSAGFSFEETPDQAAAINSVIQDMTSNKSMDRLICGDVGFGKTEVALRAVFIAVMSGKQAVVLAPTTLLVEQHAKTFIDRFTGWSVQIAELSRFRDAKEVKNILQGIANGAVNIVIGTHKILSNNVRFLHLGLVVIDEEHRFGVRQKEMLKALRAEVDILTLTATPIPRTLNFALNGVRDFSIISTVPQKRLAIKTFVCLESKEIIREACLRELNRGGQIYFLHNEVETIKNRQVMLKDLLPEMHILIAHGQMHERDLEKVMLEFVTGRANMLLCTTIIETGIDIPTTNTIIIHRADKFGLAQLHQLRGRVGRSHHQAYAYLLIPDFNSLTQHAKSRLEALQNMKELGSGFCLAMHDLEIRGAGEILGNNQSGEIHEIGFEMYANMLNKAIIALKRHEKRDLTLPFLLDVTEINLHLPALLPIQYCQDVNERLLLYKRLANCSELHAVEVLQEELLDRFGSLPEVVVALVETHKLRVLAKPLGIIKIDAYAESALLQFKNNPPINIGRVMLLVQKNDYLQFSGLDKLRIIMSMPDINSRVACLKTIMKLLKENCTLKENNVF